MWKGVAWRACSHSLLLSKRCLSSRTGVSIVSVPRKGLLRRFNGQQRLPFRCYAGISLPQVLTASAQSGDNLRQRAVQTCIRLVKWIARVAAISLILAAALPSILSTGPGLRAGTNLASHFTEGDIEIERAELGWLKPVHLTNVAYKLPAALGGEALASAQTLSTRSRLWDVIVGRKYDVYGEKPWLDCSFSESGKWKWTELSAYVAGKTVGKPISNSGAGNKQPSLVQETTEIKFSAEARLMTASVYFPNGIMKVPQEVKEVIGRDLHLTAVLGRGCMKEAREELDLDEDLSWADGPGPSSNPTIRQGVETQQSTPQEDIGTVQSATNADLEDKAQTGSEQTSSASWLSWETEDPGFVSIQSENLRVRAQGWRRRSDSAYILNQPGHLEFQYTPALAQYVLGRLSPLLSGVLAVENGVVQVDVTPDHLTSPADNYHFRIEPLRIAIQKQGLLKNAIDFLRLKRSGLERSTLLQGATSAIHVDVRDDGAIETRRIDVLVSPGGSNKGVHLCSWGGIKPTKDRLDLTLGIPADMLSFLGVKATRPEDVLTIPLTGSFARPTIDWRGAYSRLSALAASRQGQSTSIQGAILQGIVGDINKRFGRESEAEPFANVPAPIEPLPWEVDASILDDHIEVEQ